MKTLCLVLPVVFLLFSTASYAEQNDAKYYLQSAKLFDCQTISIDESFVNGKRSEKTICFWYVQAGSEKYLIMWKEVNSPNNYGFVK